MPRILVVDDDLIIRKVLQKITSKLCECDIVDNGYDALEMISSGVAFDVILLDINMPGISGYQVCEQLQKNEKLAQIPIIFISGNSDDDDVVKGLRLGAVDYIKKPFRTDIVLARLQTHLQLKQYRDNLEDLVNERTNKLFEAETNTRKSQEETIFRLAKAAEFRDNETAQHTLRMANYCKIIAMKSGLSSEKAEMIRVASQLHDVGKIGISDTILLKPGKLTSEEFEIIKQHPEIGHKILCDSESEVVQLGADIALTHHEKYNGDGYPRSLAGDNIPIAGRIAAICDVFDALTSDRVYKKAMTVDVSLDIMQKEEGQHFDPNLFDMFEDSLGEILEVKEIFTDK